MQIKILETYQLMLNEYSTINALLLLKYALKVDLLVRKTASKNKIQNNCLKER